MEVDQFNLFFVYFFLFLSLHILRVWVRTDPHYSWSSRSGSRWSPMRIQHPDPNYSFFTAMNESLLDLYSRAPLSMDIHWNCYFFLFWTNISSWKQNYFGNHISLPTWVVFCTFFLLLGSALLLFIQSDHSFFTMVPPSLLIF